MMIKLKFFFENERKSKLVRMCFLMKMGNIQTVLQKIKLMSRIQIKFIEIIIANRLMISKNLIF